MDQSSGKAQSRARRTGSLLGWIGFSTPEPTLVRTTAMLVGGISACALVATGLKEPFQPGFAAAGVIGIAAAVATLLAGRRGHHRALAYGLALAAWTAVAVGNLDEPGASGFVVASLVAGLLLGPGAAILAALGGCAVLALFGVAGSGVAEWGHYVVLLLGGASLTALVSHRVSGALEREHGTAMRYRTLVDYQPLGVFATDRDLNFTVANHAFAALLGFDSPEKIIGTNLRDGAALQLTEVRELADRILAGERGVVEVPFTSVPGKRVVLRVHGAPIRDDAGAIIGGQAVCEDISARVETERALQEAQARSRAVISADIDQVTELRADGSWTSLSQNARRAFGIDWEQADLSDHLYHEDRERIREAVERVRETRRLERIEYRLHDAEGATRWVESTIAPFEAPGGEGRLIIASRDVTERKHLEDDLTQATKMEAVGQLAAGVAHDFNNLLTVIGGHAEVLVESGSLSEQDQGSASEIMAAAERASSLTRQLLTFSRKETVQARPVPLDTTVGELEEMLRRLLGAHIAVDFQLGAGAAHVQCDPIRLEQLVVNLALNARDAMPQQGQLDIETRLESGECDEGTAILIVSDTGVGMSLETRARAFEPFFTTKAVGEGTGLGLSTAYAIVEQLGGKISVESAPNRGTTFTIRLPCTRPALQPEPKAATVASRRGTAAATILLVEDEKAVRAVARAALESAGHRVLEAADGEEALMMARSHREIDAVVTDVIMPRRSGLSVTEALRAARPGLPVLLISGYQPHPDATLPGPLLQKPFTQAGLCQAVGDLLARRVDSH